MTEPPKPADVFCRETIVGIKKKADHNKNEALAAFVVTIFATLGAPLFITLGDGRLTGKIIPSILSLLAAAATTWLQLRRPQHLWGLYRGAQRELEDEITKYNYGIGNYETAQDPAKMLASRVAAVALDLHHKWMPMIPNIEQLKGHDKPTLVRPPQKAISNGHTEQ